MDLYDETTHHRGTENAEGARSYTKKRALLIQTRISSFGRELCEQTILRSYAKKCRIQEPCFRLADVPILEP